MPPDGTQRQHSYSPASGNPALNYDRTRCSPNLAEAIAAACLCSLTATIMRPSPAPKRHRIAIIDQAALRRLTILLGSLMIVVLWSWLTLFWMPGESYQGDLLPLQGSALVLQASLQNDIEKLAVDIGMRNSGNYQNLEQASTFLQAELSNVGYAVKQQSYTIDNHKYENLVVERPGTEKANEIIVIGGHYDSTFSSPGANDNATGAAATLELAKLFVNQSPKRTLRFIEFTNEEPPYFWTENMGSLVYAQQVRQNQENIVAMLSLETMGYFSEVTGSQHYPFPIGLLYPQQGNFIAFVGNINSGKLVRQAIHSFRQHTQFPSEGVALPSWIPGVGWSDHWSFWQQGYPAIMVTDTAPYRYVYYHTDDDTLDKIDFDQLTRVVIGLEAVIRDLAN